MLNGRNRRHRQNRHHCGRRLNDHRRHQNDCRRHCHRLNGGQSHRHHRRVCVRS